MGTQTQDAAAAQEWEREMEEIREKDRAREQAARDAENIRLTKEQRPIEEELARKDFEEELCQLKKMFDEGILDVRGHLRGRVKAWKKLKEKMAWIRTFGPGLIEAIQKK